MNGNLSGNSQLLLTLVEPAIEYIIKCLFKDLKKVSPDFSLILLLCWSIVMVRLDMVMLGCVLLFINL